MKHSHMRKGLSDSTPMRPPLPNPREQPATEAPFGKHTNHCNFHMTLATEEHRSRYYDTRADRSKSPGHVPASLSMLDQDVLLQISTFLSIDDMSCFSRTSRRMYQILAREMLKRPVELWPQDIHSYLRFLRHMRREKQLPRAWQLNMNFEYGPLHKCNEYGRCAGLGCRFRDKPGRDGWFVKILGIAKGLAGLTLAGTFDFALDVQEFRSVLPRLPRLRRLTLGAHWGHSLCEYLASLQGLPELRVLELKYKPETLHLTHQGRANWEISLEAQLALLEELAIHTLVLAHDGIQLLQLRKLVTDCLVIGAGASEWGRILSKSLPNLEHLEVQRIITHIPPEEYTWPGDDVHSGPLILPDATLSTPMPDLDPLPLKYIRLGSLLDLVQLDIPCAQRLSRIDIGTLQPGANPRTVELAFDSMRPRCITFYDTPREPTEASQEVLEALLGRVDRMAYLTHVAYNTSTWVLLKSDIETLGDALGRILRLSFVTHLFVRIFELPGRDIFARQSNGATLDALVARAYGDVLKAQQALAASVPALKGVFFEVGDYGLRGWVRDETSPQPPGQWQELDEAETEEMLRKENLYCSHADQTSNCFGAPLSWTENA